MEMSAEGELIGKYVNDAESSAIWTAVPDGWYIFTHGLLRDAAYMMQMRARRQELHALAVAALEAIHVDDRKFHYAELAYHSERGELREKAFQYYTLAGKSASAVFQNAKGVEYFTKALSFTLQEDRPAQFDLYTERITLLDRMAKRDAQLKDLRTIESLAEQLDDSHRAISLMLYTVYFYLTGNYMECIDRAQRAFAFTSTQVDREFIYAARICWFLSHLRLGHPETALQLAQESLQYARADDDRRQLGRVLSAVGLVALEQKEPGGAGAYLSEALTIANEINDRSLKIRILNNLAIFETSVNGNYQEAEESYRQVVDIAREIGDQVLEDDALVNLGFIAGLQGKLSDAKLNYEKALVIARESGKLYNEIYILINLSSNAEIQNQATLGYKYAQESLALSQRAGEVSGEAWGWLYLGHAQLMMNEVEDAKRSFSKSVEIRQKLNQPTLAMEALAGLVDSALQAGNLEMAAFYTEKILAHLDSRGTLDGTDEPLRVYHSCFRLLAKKQDPRASRVLQCATEIMEAQISKIQDARARAMYIENIPWRLALWNAAKEIPSYF
jgi:tetratricopeptide (TPR) repeat protein